MRSGSVNGRGRRRAPVAIDVRPEIEVRVARAHLEVVPPLGVTVDDDDAVPEDAVNEAARGTIQHHQLNRHRPRHARLGLEAETQPGEGVRLSSLNRTPTSTSLVAVTVPRATLPNRYADDNRVAAPGDHAPGARRPWPPRTCGQVYRHRPRGSDAPSGAAAATSGRP